MKPKATADSRRKFSFYLLISYNYDVNENGKNRQTYTVRHELSEAGDQVVAEFWYQDGELSRSNGPAVTIWDADTGQKLSETWCLKGMVHRRGGPASIQYVEGQPGKVYMEEWSINDQLYRIGGPARTVYDPETGKPVSTTYNPEPRPVPPSP